MAVEEHDRTTLDMFSSGKQRGRPRTNPLSRQEQVRINKRNQVARDRTNGLKRIELKVPEALFNALNDQALGSNISRSQLIESILAAHLGIDSSSN